MNNTAIKTKQQTKMRVSTKPLLKTLLWLKRHTIGGAQTVILNTDTENGHLVLTSTNRVISIETRLPCHGHIEGFHAYNLKDLYTKAKGAIGETVDFNGVAFRSNGLSFISQNIDDVNLYTMPKLTMVAVKQDNSAFRANLLAVIQAGGCTAKSPRNYGSVVCFDSKENHLVATDGFRLAYSTFVGLAIEDKTCISFLACRALATMPGNDIALAVSEDASEMLATSCNTKIHIISSAIKYPNYLDILSTKFAPEIAVDIDCKQLKTLLATCDRSQAINIEAFAGNLKLSSKTASISIETPSYENIAKRAFNGAFLLQLLNADKTKSKVEISVNNHDLESVIRVGSNHFTTFLVPIKGQTT